MIFGVPPNTHRGDAFKGFAAVIGHEEVTPEAIAAATKDFDDNKKISDDATAAWELKKEAPDGETPEAKIIREAEGAELDRIYYEAEAKKNAALARETALLGQKLLTEALDHGPLSAESGQRLKTGSPKVVAAYVKNPRLADTAVKALATAKHPEAIVNGLDAMVYLVSNGFLGVPYKVEADNLEAVPSYDPMPLTPLPPAPHAEPTQGNTPAPPASEVAATVKTLARRE